MMDVYTQPDYASIALITIDVQRDTLDGQPFEIPGTSAALPHIRQLLQVFRRAGKPIVHMVRLYKPDGSNGDLCRRGLVEGGSRVLTPGSPGCELAEELLPDPNLRLDTDLLLEGEMQFFSSKEVVLYKPRWGAFYKTRLGAYLHEQGVSTLAFTGCNFPNCPRASLYEASERDFKIVLVEDAVSGLYERGKEEMRGIGVHVTSAKALIDVVSRMGERAFP